ncbi:MAG: energy-coupling factor transporter ATPase [Bacillota bacterium]|nr:energy-coupling factor transporter ATPase [Bacillota bacterium]
MAESGILISNLSHIYDAGSAFASPAIADINLEIGSGELIGIIGHTGSGKSTLIQHINGLLKPTFGKIVVAGLQIADETQPKGVEKKRKKISKKELVIRQKNVIEIRKKVGLVFQYPEYQLFEETVEKDIMFGPLNLGVSETEARARVKKSMEQVGLDYDLYATRSPFELSGGQKRRVAIAGVLAMEPDVLILDEPTAGLDPMGRDELLNEIHNLHMNNRTTILVVSHSMDDMARLAQRILVISKGRIVLDGSPKQVFFEEKLLKEVGLDVPEVCKTLRLTGAGGSVIDPAAGVDELERWVRSRDWRVKEEKHA